VAPGITIVGDVITNVPNAPVVNQGTVTIDIRTFSPNSGVTNSGTINQALQTEGANSGVVNSGSVGTNLQTIGANSGVTNSGSVGTNITTTGVNSDVMNSGSVGTNITTTGANSSVTNAGSVGSGAAGDGIFINGANPTLTLLTGSIIQGQLDLAGAGTRTLNVVNGLNAMLTFVTAPNVINTNGAPFAVNGTQVAVLDPTAIGQADEMLADLTSGIFNAVHARLNGAGLGAANSFFGRGADASSRMGLGAAMHLRAEPAAPVSHDRRSGIWVQAFAGHRKDDSSGPTVGALSTYEGGIAGVDGWLMPGVRIGGFAGGARAELDTAFNAQEINVDSFFGGGYASFRQESWFAHVMLSAGRSGHDSTRRVVNNLAPGGIQFGTASYNGDFISPEMTVGTTFAIGGLVIEPSGRLRYAHISLDGYSETGVADGLSIASRDVSLWLGRAQVAFPFADENGTFSPRVGVEAWSSDSDNVSAVLLGQTLSFRPGGQDDEVTGFVGATATANLDGNTTLYLDGEMHFDGDGYSRSEARGGFRVRF